MADKQRGVPAAPGTPNLNAIPSSTSIPTVARRLRSRRYASWELDALCGKEFRPRTPEPYTSDANGTALGYAERVAIGLEKLGEVA